MTDMTPILLAPWGRNGSTAVMRLLASGAPVAAPSRHPYELYWLTSMLRASQVLTAENKSPAGGWGHDHLFPDVWEDSLRPVWYDDPGLIGERDARRHLFLGLWRGFCEGVQMTRAETRRAPARYYAEKSHLRIARLVADLLDCRVLFVMRDPRDLLLSSADFNRKRRNFRYGWDGRTRMEKQVRAQIDALRSDLAFFDMEFAGRDAGLLIRYEDMVTAPDAFAATLGGWLDVELDPDVLQREAEEHGARHMTSADMRSSAGRWRTELPDKAARLYADIANDILERFDYGR